MVFVFIFAMIGLFVLSVCLYEAMGCQTNSVKFWIYLSLTLLVMVAAFGAAAMSIIEFIRL